MVSRIVRSVRRHHRWADPDDLCGAGILALVQSASRASGTPEEVRAFCAARVRGAILDELRRRDPLSRQHRVLARQAAEVGLQLQRSLGRAPSDTEIARSCEVDPRRLAAMRRAAAVGHAESLEEVAEGVAAEEPTPADKVAWQDSCRALRDAVAQLPARERTVIATVYLEGETLSEAAGRVGVCPAYAMHLRASGITQLRRRLGHKDRV